jgi:hypothetical protein
MGFRLVLVCCTGKLQQFSFSLGKENGDLGRFSLVPGQQQPGQAVMTDMGCVL